MTSGASASSQRDDQYRQLLRHNRWIGRARWGVPVLGALVFLLLVGQIYVSNLASQFGISGISIQRDMAVIETPEYAGVLSDGTAYRVAAGEARAPLAATNKIELADSWVLLTSPDGTETRAEASLAHMDIFTQEILVDGMANVETSDGTLGQFEHTVIDWQNQTFTSTGGARILMGDGTSIVADQAVYDLQTRQWTFSRAKVVLPSTPGEEPQSSGETDR